MSMVTQHYFGWFIMTQKKIDILNYFPNEEWCRVFDEGDCEEINDSNIIIPNRHNVPNCFSFDKYTEHGLTLVECINDKPILDCPKFVLEALVLLAEEAPTLHFGHFTYAY